jgi:hypothetical protein
MDMLQAEAIPDFMAGSWHFLVMFCPPTADISWTCTCAGMDKSLQFVRVLLSVLETEVFLLDRKSTRLNSSHLEQSRMPSSA